MSKDFYSTRYSYIGLILYTLTPLLFLVGYVLIPYAKAKNSFLYSCLTLVAVLGSGLCFRYARRARTRIVRSVDALLQYIKTSKETLILFLREFSTEGSRVNDEQGNDLSRTLFVTQEDVLADALKEYGVMVAIGKPGERLPTSGAYRLYVDNDIWKPTVTELITQADTIFLRCGDTSGLSWELEQIVEYQKLPHTIFLSTVEAMRTLQRIRSWKASSDPDKLSLRSILDKIAQIDIRDEDKKLKATTEKVLQETPLAIKQLEAIENVLDSVRVSAATLFLIEAGHPVPFDGPLYEAIPKVLDHIGIPYKKLTLGRLKAALGLFLAFSPFLLFGSFKICEWLEM